MSINIDALFLSSVMPSCHFEFLYEELIDNWSEIYNKPTNYRLILNQALCYKADESRAVYYTVIERKEVYHKVIRSEIEDIYSYELTKKKELMYIKINDRDETPFENVKTTYEIVKNKGIQYPVDVKPPPEVSALPSHFTITQANEGNLFYSSPKNLSLYHYSWFHGHIGDNEAEELLNATRDGTFLVRESPKGYTLSIFNEGQVVHYNIHGSKEELEFYCEHEKKFRSLSKFVGHYKYSNTFPMRYPLQRIEKTRPKFHPFEATSAADSWEKSRSDFTLNNKIGEGQYGNVYRAVLLDSGKVVAVKAFKVCMLICGT